MAALNSLQRRLLFAGLAACAAALCQLAHAQPVSDGSRTADIPASYQQAQAALQQQRWADARHWLQDTLRQHPDMAGAWLDLAWVAWAQGQPAEAEELLLALQQQFDPLPVGIQSVVDQLRLRLADGLVVQDAVLAPVSSAQAERSLGLLLAAGHDSNANAGLRAGFLTLNLASGDVSLPLDPSSQRRSAAFVRGAVQHQGQTLLDGQPLHWLVQLQARQYPGLHAYDVLELDSQLQTPVSAKSSSVVGLGWRAAWVGSQATYQAPGVRWQSDERSSGAPEAGCRWRQRMQYEWRQYLRAPALDSHQLAYRLGLHCNDDGQPIGFSEVEAALELPANADRPGDRSHRLSWGLGRDWQHPLGLAGHRLQASAQLEWVQDSAGYSPLLDQGRARQLRRVDWSLAWTLPPSTVPGPDWRWMLSLQRYRQGSNIPLFALDGRVMQAVLWRHW